MCSTGTACPHPRSRAGGGAGASYEGQESEKTDNVSNAYE